MRSNKKSLWGFVVLLVLFGLRSISSKTKIKETVGQLVNAAEDLVTKNMEKFDVLSGYFASVFIGKVCSQASQVPESTSRFCRSEAVPTTEEDKVRKHLRK